ncbi:hypothetical protein F4824DRAFT_492600 [Ustulina deusta]|nr:hypothetical protein F4824DRAFT_492600 [Ustulina deusta]
MPAHLPQPLKDERVIHALSLFDSIELPHSSSYLLMACIYGSFHLASAACYVSDRLSGDTVAQNAIARRDGDKCCITGNKGIILDPLCADDCYTKERIFNLLGATFGQSYRDWWLDYAKGSGFTIRMVITGWYGDMLLYRVSHVHIGPQKPVEVDGSLPLLCDHSRTGIERVDARFIGTHARLCNSIGFLDVASTISPEILCESRPGLRGARKLGKTLYGATNNYYSPVQRLPFGLFLKFNSEPACFRNEFKALQLVRQHTTVPVPKPLDIAIIRQRDGTASESSFPDRDRIADQMKKHLAQVWSIPNFANRDARICNILVKACRDSRTRGEKPVGPFPDEASFSQVLRFSDEPRRSVIGIVDWEFAGYYFEYWDYTKALSEGFRWIKRYNDMVKEIFNEFGDYSREVDVETRSWVMGDGV